MLSHLKPRFLSCSAAFRPCTNCLKFPRFLLLVAKETRESVSETSPPTSFHTARDDTADTARDLVEMRPLLLVLLLSDSVMGFFVCPLYVGK